MITRAHHLAALDAVIHALLRPDVCAPIEAFKQRFAMRQLAADASEEYTRVYRREFMKALTKRDERKAGL